MAGMDMPAPTPTKSRKVRVTSVALTDAALLLLEALRGARTRSACLSDIVAERRGVGTLPAGSGRTRYPGKRWRRPVVFRLTSDDANALDHMAATKNISRNDLVEALVRRASARLLRKEDHA